MIRVRTLLAVGLFIIALVLIAVPSTAAAVPVTGSFVRLIGGGFLVAGLVIATSRRDTSQPEPPRSEEAMIFPYPGVDVDSTLKPLSEDPDSPAAKRVQGRVGSSLKAQLRALAEHRIQDQYNVSERQARAAIETGAWTTDPHAKAFFTEYPDGKPLRTRLKLALRVQSSDISVQARQAIRSIEQFDTPGTGTAPTRAQLLESLDAMNNDHSTEDNR